MRFRRVIPMLALAAVAAPAAAQTGEALLKSVASFTPVKNPTFPVPAGDVYKAVWDINAGAEKPSDVDPRFKDVATFLVMSDDAGIPRKNVKLAMVVHGNSAKALLQNDAYKAMTGVDNPNIALLEALNAVGVQVIICGQSIPNRKLPADKLLSFVKVSLSATFAHVTLHSQGYYQF
jgi:intracellular sulfur oxidation DsrE/DsrF family protein